MSEITRPILTRQRKKREAKPLLRGFRKNKNVKQETLKELLLTPITDQEAIIRYRDYVRREKLNLTMERVAVKASGIKTEKVNYIPKASLEILQSQAKKAEKEYMNELEAMAIAKRQNKKFKPIYLDRAYVYNIPKELSDLIGYNQDDIRPKKKDPKHYERKKAERRSGVVKDEPNPLVPLPAIINQRVKPGPDRIENLTRNQNVSEHVIRFYNDKGWLGLYEKVEDVLDKFETKGLVNVKLAFENDTGGKMYRSILQKHLNSREDFEDWIQNIFSENVTGSDNQYAAGEWSVVPDMFEFNVITYSVKGGVFTNPILPVENLESASGECVRAVLERLNKSIPTYLNNDKEEVLKLFGDMMVIENIPLIKVNLTRKKLTHILKGDEWVPREMFTHNREKFYRLNFSECYYFDAINKQLTDFDNIPEQSLLIGETLDYDDSEPGSSKKLNYHIDVVKKPIDGPSNIYFNGSDFSVNKQIIQEAEIPKPLEVGKISKAKDSFSHACDKLKYMKILVSHDYETVSDFDNGCIFKVYSASFSVIPMFLINYIVALTLPGFEVNLANLMKYKTQRIPFEGIFDEKDHEIARISAFYPMGEEYRNQEYKYKHTTKVKDGLYNNICIDEEGYFKISLFDKTVKTPTSSWSVGIDSPLDLLYETCFKTKHINTRYKFITFNGTAFDNLFFFEYGQARATLEKNENENVRFVKPLFVKGLLNMQIQEAGGITHDCWDLVKHIPGSLASLSKKWGIGALCKGSLNHDEVQKAYTEKRFSEYIDANIEKIQNYNTIDTLAPLAIAAKYQKTLLEIEPVKKMFEKLRLELFDIMTIGTLTNNITKLKAAKNEIDFKPLPFVLYEDVRNSAVAGRCDLVNGPCVINGPIGSLDIKSAYPYVCAVGPYYFPHGDISFITYEDYYKIPSKPKTLTDYDDGRPLGFFYGTVDWSNLKVNPGLAMKTKEGNDWKAQIFDSWVSTEFINHLLENGATFTPKRQTEEKITEIIEDYFDLNKKPPNLTVQHEGFIFSGKCKGIKIFEHILEFMKIKNEQDQLKETANKYVDYVNACFMRDIEIEGDLKTGLSLYLTDIERSNYNRSKCDYNESLRETCKLMSNAATGKPMEDIHVEKYIMLNHPQDFLKYKAMEKENKIHDLVADKLHESGLIAHYKINKKDKQRSQNPFYVTSFIYDYTRIKLYNDTYKTLPDPSRAIYSDTDSTKIRNYIDPTTGINDLEFAYKNLSKIRLPHCEEALAYDPRLSTAYLNTPNIYGTYEDEMPDKERKTEAKQAYTVFYGKKFYTTIGISLKHVEGEIIPVVISTAAKGVNINRDVIIEEDNILRYEDVLKGKEQNPNHWVVEYAKRDRKGLIKVHYTLKNVTQQKLHYHLIAKKEANETLKSAKGLNSLIKAAQTYGSAYILTAPFKKHLRNMSSTHQDNSHLSISSSVGLKKLTLTKFT